GAGAPGQPDRTLGRGHGARRVIAVRVVRVAVEERPVPERAALVATHRERAVGAVRRGRARYMRDQSDVIDHQALTPRNVRAIFSIRPSDAPAPALRSHPNPGSGEKRTECASFDRARSIPLFSRLPDEAAET